MWQPIQTVCLLSLLSRSAVSQAGIKSTQMRQMKEKQAANHLRITNKATTEFFSDFSQPIIDTGQSTSLLMMMMMTMATASTTRYRTSPGIWFVNKVISTNENGECDYSSCYSWLSFVSKLQRKTNGEIEIIAKRIKCAFDANPRWINAAQTILLPIANDRCNSRILLTWFDEIYLYCWLVVVPNGHTIWIWNEEWVVTTMKLWWRSKGELYAYDNRQHRYIRFSLFLLLAGSGRDETYSTNRSNLIYSDNRHVHRTQRAYTREMATARQAHV